MAQRSDLTDNTNSRTTVLLMAYECSPAGGSELSVGWNRVMQAAREFEVHVITSPKSFEALTMARQSGLLPDHVHFYTPQPDWLLPLLQKLPVLFVYNYLAYQHFQRLAFNLAQQLHGQHGFAAVHQVNGTGFREPGYTWKMDIPFIWGPTGGTQNFPAAFLSYLPWREALKESLRTIVNQISLRFKPRVHQAAARASVVFAANSTNQRDFEESFGRPIELLLETGLPRLAAATSMSKYDGETPLRILWVGELATRKALPLLLRALASVKDELAFELQVLGKGPQEQSWKELAASLGIERHCTFSGHLALADAIAQQDWAHVFVFTSLRDTSGNVMLEALGAGVPVVCFDHQGAGDIVTSECGVKIAVVDPETAVHDFAAVLMELAGDRKRLRQLSHGARRRAIGYEWTANGDRMNRLYRELAAGEAEACAVPAEVGGILA
ncbi:glycosyltransferase [Granulicella tundricola]|uniref:Glycosyl transferase group 1 n=1 Tax=Granulicella tundricola (strain ATCC BAA-1859 / DSM 23138 / MP5ACTX9) TaxID=1198114 RepID=E8X6T3_GRATM|nr:glycosyltransferase [Granulicella tundricola]ADW71233.1 glycosyl transferase group 1 [Granulicella tundricola MP5ACTX9]